MRLTWPRILAGSVLVADVLILRWVGVPFWVQLYFAVFLAACAGTGALFLRRKHAVFPDHACFALVSLATGLALHMALCFVGLHDELIRSLHLADQRSAMQVAFGIVVALGIVGWIRAGRNLPALRWCAHPGAASTLFALASLIAFSTHFGYGNDLTFKGHGRDEGENWVVVAFLDEKSDLSFDAGGRAPEWGSRIDSLMYIWLMPRWIEHYALPDVFGGPTSRFPTLGFFQHAGTSVQLLGVLDVIAPFSAQSSTAVSKLLSLVWLCLLGAWLFWIGKAVFGLSESAATAAGAGGFLFSAIALGAFGGSVPRPSNTLTYLATPIYWNLNQLSQLAIGLGGLFLVLLDLARRRGVYAVGCTLIAASLYFKPSFYFVVVPAIGLASLRLGRGFLRADVLLGWLAIVLAYVFWFYYPEHYQLNAIHSPPDVGFLQLQIEWAHNGVIPQALILPLQPFAVKALILLLVVGAWVLPACALVASCMRSAARCRSGIASLARPEVLALLLLLAWGLFTGLCFVEDNERRNFGAYMFGCGAAHTAALPLLVLGITRIESRSWRWCAWTVYAAHLASGLFNLWIYARTGSIS